MEVTWQSFSRFTLILFFGAAISLIGANELKLKDSQSSRGMFSWDRYSKQKVSDQKLIENLKGDHGFEYLVIGKTKTEISNDQVTRDDREGFKKFLNRFKSSENN